MAEQKNLCYNCFQEREVLEGPCPYCGFDLADNEKRFPVALRAGTVLNGRYIVGRVLGQGGFGITYLALDTQLNAKVAIKEFMPNDIATRIGTTVSVAMDTKSEEFAYGAERFQEEARTLAKFIGNPNIAAVTSYFDENDTSYFVMDYIEGISFKTYIANHGGKISVEETLNVMIPVLRALTAVHAEGFIHRDVTPDNIYITKDGMVKLLDFGSARYSIGDKSKSLDVILKVVYAPKEQYIRRSRQGPFTEVYSYAACFYAAITGFLPPEALERLEHDELVPISQCGIDIPESIAVSWGIMACSMSVGWLRTHGWVTMRSGWSWCSASMRRSRSSFGRSWKVRLSCPVSWHIALRRWELGASSHLALNPGMGAMRGVMVWQSWFAK